MSDAVFFITHIRVKEGMPDALKQYCRQVAETTEASKPGALAHMARLNDDGAIHLFPAPKSRTGT